MNADTYYRDHWVEVEPERVSAYEEMFQWRPQMEPLIAGAQLEAGQRVVDYGCGPGMLSLELARRVGPAGHVHAIDLNALFLDRAREHAAQANFLERLSFHQIKDDRIPLADDSVDRVICKNVLEYVADVVETLADFRRVLQPGGLAHMIDSDWGMLVVEPLGPDRIAQLFRAASVAYRTPLIGRKLYAFMSEAGFADVRVEIRASADVRGHFSPILRNMASYARASGRLSSSFIDELLADLESAIADGSYLLVLPQFLVTGRA